MKNMLALILALFVGSFYGETYSCPYSLDGTADLVKFDRIEGENLFRDLIFPNDFPWEIHYEDEKTLALITSIGGEGKEFYDLWTFIINKETLEFQWADINNNDVPKYPFTKGKCYLESK